MENSNQKWVNMSFLAVSVLIAYILFAGFFKLAGVYDFESKVKNVDLIIRFGSIGIGTLLFIILYKNETVNQFMHETVTELSRVTWPTTKDTLSSTWVVLIMVLITGLLLGLMDKFWTLVIQWIL